MRAIVTGASRGIGRSIAASLTEQAWEVYNFDRVPPKALNNHDPRWVEVDLAQPEAIRDAMAGILQEGPVTGLVNNAAIGLMDSLEQTQREDMERSYAINLQAPMLLAQALVPAMKEARFGRIVNISSRAHLGKTERSAYAATKGGLISMTRVWALELAQFGVTCNAVAPGPIGTELFHAANPPEMPRTQEILESIPVGRLGEPGDIANAVSFFMSKSSGFVTGQILHVCGGITLARGGS